MEDLEQKLASLEALLFVHGEPVPNRKIESVLGVDAAAGEILIAEMKRRLEDEGRGVQLIAGGGKVQLVTKPAFNGILEHFVREELSEDLTPASLEALSIVAYLGPVSRAKIEYLRGVNSLVILRSLMIRGLIERIPDPEHPAVFLYQPTFDFLKQLGLQNKEDLPDFANFKNLVTSFEAKVAGGAAAETSATEPQT